MWAMVWPFFLAAWMFLFSALCSFIARLAAGPHVGTNPPRWRAARRELRCVFYLSAGFGGLILVVSLPSWFYWGQLHARGVPVSARVVSHSLEYDTEWGKQYTLVTYEFEAEVDGQRRPFQREGKLKGWHIVGSVQILHHPSDPSDSRMVHEGSDASDVLLSLASFLVLGVASFLLARRLSPAGAAAPAGGEVPPADRTGPGRRTKRRP
jgi:hypothetical protein